MTEQAASERRERETWAEGTEKGAGTCGLQSQHLFSNGYSLSGTSGYRHVGDDGHAAPCFARAENGSLSVLTLECTWKVRSLRRKMRSLADQSSTQRAPRGLNKGPKSGQAKLLSSLQSSLEDSDISQPRKEVRDGERG